MASPTSPLGHNPLDTIRSKLPYALKHGTVEEIARLLEFPGALEVELDFYVPGSTRYPATGFPPLLLAASFKRPEIVTLLLDLGANINQKAPCECTVLHIAALCGRLKNLKIFLARGALSLVNAPMTTGQFPLTEAAWKGHVKICRLLLDSGAMVDVQDHYCTPLWYAASADKEAVIQLLLEAKADANGMSHNFSSLHIAAESNCPKAIKILLEKGHADSSLQDAEGNTALQRAAIMGSGDAVSQLLSHTPTFIEHQNYFGDTALNLAVKKRRPHIVTTLLKHNANINSADEEQTTPLLNACLYGWGDVVSVLLGYEVMMDQKDTFGNTPLHLAAYNGYFGICSTILKRGADVDSANNMQETPILVAAYEGHKNVAQLLLQHNAAADTVNIQKRTPLHIASENGHLNVVSLLLDHLSTADFVDVYDTTPLHVACGKGHAQVAELLLNHGAKLEPFCTSRRTPLWYASENGHVKVMAVLVARGADINIGDANGQTPLHKACLNKHTEAIEFLVDQGADFNKFNVSKKSALWEAWCSSDIDSVRPLIQTKSGSLRTDFQGNSALHHSCSQGNTKMVEKLLEDKRIDPSARNDDDNSPLDLAVNKRYVQVIFSILASQHYYPSCSISFQSYRTKMDHVTPLYWCLQSIVDEGSRSKDELSIVLYWAIANNRPYLINSCLRCFPEDRPLMKGRMTCLHVAAQHGRHELIKKSLRQFDLNQTMDEGITPLQIAAANGDPETATALLGMVQMGSDKRLEAIIQLNNANECSLSLAMKGRHSMTKDLLWAEIKAFIGLRKDYHKDNPEGAERTIELCAQLEKPGKERLLLRILKEWFPPPITNTESWTILHFAAYHGQAVAVWWLLSHGAHLKSDEIDLARRILKPDEDCVSQIIDDLLNNLPQIIEHTAITENDFMPAFPKDPKNMEELLGLPVAIIDFYGSQKMMNFHYTRRKVHEVIYDPSRGPKRVMEEARRNNRRQLGFLKNELQSQTTSPAAERRLQVSNYAKKTSEDKSDTGDLQFRWIHLPANHMKLMDDLLTVLSIESQRTEKDYRSFTNFFDRSWTQIAAGGGNKYMKAQCIKEQPVKTTGELPSGENDVKVALYMPYVTLGEIMPQGTGGPKNQYKIEKLRDQPEFSQSQPFEEVTHRPLTLDQFYYPTIEDTMHRDLCQVVSRFLKSSADNEAAKLQQTVLEPEKLKILLVDQLWLWIVDERTIMTATTKPSSQSEDIIPARVRELLMLGDSKGLLQRPNSVQDMVNLILGISTGLLVERTIPTCTEPSLEERKSPLEVFRLSIRKVADKEARLFEAFMKSLEQESQSQKDHAEKSVNHNSKSHPDRFIRDSPMNPYHIIDQEAHLLNEIKDIRDEMNMLRALVEAQDNVWKQAFIPDNPSDSSSWNNICTPRQVLQELEEMKVEAEMIQEAINTLLDLRQKQATIKEAEFGRRQANDTGKQSNIILVFTIVTIVFLPLSFLSSLFALDVSVFPHESSDLKYPGWWIFPMIFGISACVSTPLIYVAFNVNGIIKLWEQFKRSRQAKTGSHSTQPASKALGSHELKTPQWEQGRTHEHEHQRGQEPEVNARHLRNLARRWRGSRKEDKFNSSVV